MQAMFGMKISMLQSGTHDPVVPPQAHAYTHNYNVHVHLEQMSNLHSTRQKIYCMLLCHTFSARYINYLNSYTLATYFLEGNSRTIY